MNYSYEYSGFVGSVNKDTIRYLGKKAEEMERNYKWLQAADFHKKISKIALKDNALARVAKLQEKIGFCFYRGAFQAQNHIEFRKLVKQAIRTYDEESKLLEKTANKNAQTRINHFNALSAYARSFLEKDPNAKKNLLSKWWSLENQVLETYEQNGDLHSIGRTCNDLIEYSYYRYWLVSDYLETITISKECIALAEKAIQILSKLDDTYELARAYCFASWYYSWSVSLWESEEKSIQLTKTCQKYSNKALDLSKKTVDAWLIGWSYITAFNAAQFGKLNPALALELGKQVLKYGNVARDNFLTGFGNFFCSFSTTLLTGSLEDPDKQKENYEKARNLSQEATSNFHNVNHFPGLMGAYPFQIATLTRLASIEADPKRKQSLFKLAFKSSQEGLQELEGLEKCTGFLLEPLSVNLYLLSETKTEIQEKRVLLQESELYAVKNIKFYEKFLPFSYLQLSGAHYQLALVQEGLAKTHTKNTEKVDILSKAIISLDKCIELVEKKKKFIQTSWASGYYFGKYNFKLGTILQEVHALTHEKKSIARAIKAYKDALVAFEKAEMPTHVAESYWHTAQLNDQLGSYKEASENYELASRTYELVVNKIPQLKDFYEDYSLYMQAWSQIEEARYFHSIEDYEEAKVHYEKSAELHESTEHWSYLTPNYCAWANMEEAESLSRKENTQQAKTMFQKALEQFARAEEAIKQKTEEVMSTDEKEMAQKLFKASNLRRKYCQARILMEDAKLLDREGNYLQSSRSYGEATKNISAIIEKIEAEAERKELELLTILCQAWEKMALAEEATSSESYLKAAKLFENAKARSFTKKASLWALGNSNFCKGLAAGIDYQTSLDPQDHARAKKYMKGAATSYLQAGFKNASEYAKATQRLFDAYIYMNRAEEETDPEQTMKYYSMAEKVLRVSAGSFMKAKQPEKTAQVQQILKTVREEKAMAASLNDVLHAPTITSSTITFTAPSPTNEVSVGLEQFQHANVQANLIAGMKEVKIGESFCLSIEFVNAGREPALLTKVEGFVPPDFIVVKKPEIYRIEDSCLNMKGKQIAPLKLVEVKLVLQPSKKGVYTLKPTVHYLDELGQNKSLQLKSVEINVKEVNLADRVSTGTKELDSILLGGIPEEYAIALTGPPSDEREYLIKNFLEAGVKEGQTSFYVAAEADNLENLLSKSNFYLFLCNPKSKVEVPDLPNVTKLRGKTDINNLSMALARESRSLQAQQNPKRLCIDVVSDVLLEYGAKTTRKWLAELLTDIGSKGFTILAVINPEMHTSDQTGALLDLFDGEISITQAEDPLECRKSVFVKKLRNQDFIKNPICLTKPIQ